MGHRSVIGIDPGKRTGFAVFYRGQLWQAATIDAGDFEALPEAPWSPVVVVIEVPRIYPHGGKGDPNQLIDLAVLAGEISGWYRARYGARVVFVTPRNWKGTVPKVIHNRRVLMALTPSETAILPTRPRAGGYDHNMIDAVGLALWHLERV